MTPKKGFRSGLIVSGIFLLLFFLGILIVGIISYDGYCISFEPPQRECNIFEFLYPYLLLLVVYSVVGRPILALIFFSILLPPPVIGFSLGYRKSKADQNN